MKVDFLKLYKLYREGDGDGDGDGDGSGEGGGQEPKTFTQEQVNEIVKNRLAKEKKQQDTLTSQLKSLRETANLTAQETNDL